MDKSQMTFSAPVVFSRGISTMFNTLNFLYCAKRTYALTPYSIGITTGQSYRITSWLSIGSVWTIMLLGSTFGGSITWQRLLKLKLRLNPRKQSPNLRKHRLPVNP